MAQRPQRNLTSEQIKIVHDDLERKMRSTMRSSILGIPRSDIKFFIWCSTRSECVEMLTNTIFHYIDEYASHSIPISKALSIIEYCLNYNNPCFIFSIQKYVFDIQLITLLTFENRKDKIRSKIHTAAMQLVYRLQPYFQQQYTQETQNPYAAEYVEVEPILEAPEQTTSATPASEPSEAEENDELPDDILPSSLKKSHAAAIDEKPATESKEADVTTIQAEQNADSGAGTSEPDPFEGVEGFDPFIKMEIPTPLNLELQIPIVPQNN